MPTMPESTCIAHFTEIATNIVIDESTSHLLDFSSLRFSNSMISRSFIQRSLRYSTPSLSRSSRLLYCSYNSIVRTMSSSSSQYEYILVSRPEPSVLLVTLNRPKSLNALSSPLFKELNQALEDADKDDSIGAMVLTGSEKAFAGLPPPHKAYVASYLKSCVSIAGADIKEMKDKQCEQTPSWSYIYSMNFPHFKSQTCTRANSWKIGPPSPTFANH